MQPRINDYAKIKKKKKKERIKNTCAQVSDMSNPDIIMS